MTVIVAETSVCTMYLNVFDRYCQKREAGEASISGILSKCDFIKSITKNYFLLNIDFFFDQEKMGEIEGL